MARQPADTFECTACGQRTPKWMGRCPGCGAWNTLEALPQSERPHRAHEGTRPIPSTKAGEEDTRRTTSGMAGVERVLGGGFVPGSVVLLAGEPGVGKSTLLLQLAARVATTGPVLYVTAEESAAQVGDRARRLGCLQDNLLLLPEAVVESALAVVAEISPALLVVDSVQTMLSERVPSIPGSVSQVREVASQVVEYAKRSGTPAVLVGHVTKDGTVAGPRALEHLVDAVLEFSGATTHAHRSLRTLKNRFGPTLELALLAMHASGLEEITNPSEALLKDRRAQSPGSAVAVVIEGTTPLLVEVQALVSRSSLANPRRVGQGVDAGRMAMLLAVLEKRAGLRLAERDVFVNVVGGLAIEEPAVDLALTAAVVSSAADVALPADLALFGEVGLLGEVRAVPRPAERLREARLHGFARCAMAASSPVPADGTTPEVVPLDEVSQLIALATPAR